MLIVTLYVCATGLADSASCVLEVNIWNALMSTLFSKHWTTGGGLVQFVATLSDQRSYSTPGPVSTGIGSTPAAGNLSQFNRPPRSTQPGHPFVGRCNEYQSKGGDALRLGSKGRYGVVCR